MTRLCRSKQSHNINIVTTTCRMGGLAFMQAAQYAWLLSQPLPPNALLSHSGANIWEHAAQKTSQGARPQGPVPKVTRRLCGFKLVLCDQNHSLGGTS